MALLITHAGLMFTFDMPVDKEERRETMVAMIDSDCDLLDFTPLNHEKTLVCDDDAVMKKLPINKTATALYRTYTGKPHFVHGNVIIYGEKDIPGDRL